MVNKLIVAAIASLGILGSVLSDGQVTPSEWVEVVLAGLNPLAVFAVANVPPLPPPPRAPGKPAS